MQNNSTRKILILSDIHGNKEALQAVDRYIRKHTVEEIVCLGDTIGYGTDGEWCVSWLTRHHAKMLMGNHESMLLGEDSNKCSAIGKKAVEWMRENTDPLVVDKIKQLPSSYTIDNICFTHAGNDEAEKWPYIKTYEEAKKHFIGKYSIYFFGHTHRACVVDSKQNSYLLQTPCNIQIDKNKVYYLNPGSVGQNRGKYTKASFMVVTMLEQETIIEYHLLPYKSYDTYRKIRDNKLGEEIANYLIREKWREFIYKTRYKYLRW